MVLCAGTPVLGQGTADERMMLRVVPPSGVHLFAISIEACTFEGAFIDGFSGLYDCPLTDVLEVSLAAPLPGSPAVDRVWGIVVPRSLDAAALPLYPFVEMTTYAFSEADARGASIVPQEIGGGRDTGGVTLSGDALVDEHGRRFRLGADGRVIYLDLDPPARSPFPRRRPEPGDVALIDIPVDGGETGNGNGVTGGETVGETGGDNGTPVVGSEGGEGGPVVDVIDETGPVIVEPTGPVLAESVVLWPAPLGPVTASGVETMRGLDSAATMNLAALTYQPARAEAGEVVLALVRNPSCTALFQPPPDVTGIVELSFNCRIVEVATTGVPGAAQAACQPLTGDRLSCLVAEDTATLVFSTATWGDIALPVAAAAGQPLMLGDHAPRSAVPVPRLAPAILSPAPGETCADFRSELRFAGYCAGTDTASCRAAPAGAAVGRDGALPSLQAAGWSTGLPGYARLQVVLNGSVALDSVSPMSRSGLQAFEASAASARRPPTLPLSLDIADDQFGNGRSVQFFGDQACGGASTGSLDLALRGLGRPSARVCGGLRVFRDGQPASACTPVALAPDGATLRATLPRDACAADRVVVAVVQNSSLNGSASRATTQALGQIVNAMGGGTNCLPIDIATTQSERRDVLARAEGVFFGSRDPVLDAIDAMSYVNPASQLLRDLGWIYRTWGTHLGALVLIADGSGTFVADITDSPEAMAWELRRVPVVLIDPSGRNSCATFEDQLFFDTCLSVTPDTLAATLLAEVDRGIRSLRGVRNR